MPSRYTVRYHPAVVRNDIPGLDRAVRGRIKKAIEQKLMVAPDIFGVPLRRSLKGYRKLRVGDYRLVFRLSEDNVYILAILHRRVVYEQMEKRA